MKLEDQVISLPMAQRLKELGVKQESYFSWFKYQYSKRKLKYPGKMGRFTQQEFCGILKSDEPFSADYAVIDKSCAFTVAELGQLLPDSLTVDHYRMHFHSYKQEQYKKPALWTCTLGHSTDKEVPDFDRHNEAEARGALLIHLLESNLITIEEVNSRI